MSAALITALGGVASAGLNALSQARTNAVNRQQADYAFQQQQQAIQRMNEYNSPAQQIVRMKAAGLNPSLAYGADGAMVGNQADIPAYNAIPAEAPNIGNLGSAMSEAIRTGIDVEDLKIRQDLAVSEIATQGALQYQAVMQGDLNDAQKTEILRLLGYKEQDYEAGIQLKWENVLKAREEIANLKEERKEIRSRIGVNEAQVQELVTRSGLNETQIYAILSRLPHEIAAMDAQAAFDWCQTDVGRAQIAKINREISHIGFVEWSDQRDFDFDKASKVADLEFKRYEYKLDIAKQLMSTIGVVTGAAAMRRGETLPPVRSNPRAPITSGHQGAGTLRSPAPKQRHPAPGSRY